MEAPNPPINHQAPNIVNADVEDFENNAFAAHAIIAEQEALENLDNVPPPQAVAVAQAAQVSSVAVQSVKGA